MSRPPKMPASFLAATSTLVEAQIGWLDTLSKCLKSGELKWEELPPEMQRAIRGMVIAFQKLDNLPRELRGMVEN